MYKSKEKEGARSSDQRRSINPTGKCFSFFFFLPSFHSECQWNGRERERNKTPPNRSELLSSAASGNVWNNRFFFFSFTPQNGYILLLLLRF